jgi:hypothetical protein
MGKYARGKKSYAISDISGLRVKYTKLKTTWDGLRVSPEDYEPKHPQLTPAKNVVDATALFNGRPDNDPENVVVYIGFTQDWTIDPRLRPSVGVSSIGNIGYSYLEITNTAQTGVGGTGAIGIEEVKIFTQVNPVGQAGTGAIGSEALESTKSITGIGSTGAIGSEVPQVSLTETGVGATGAVGTEGIELYLNETGVSGVGAVGNHGESNGKTIHISLVESGLGGTGGVGSEIIEITLAETGVSGTGATGDATDVLTNLGWGENAFGIGEWGR